MCFTFFVIDFSSHDFSRHDLSCTLFVAYIDFSRHDGVCHVVPLLIGMTFVYELASLIFHVIAVTCIVFPHVGVTFVHGLTFVHCILC